MTEPRMNKLLTFPHAAYLMVRLDYMLICETELEAKILRIIEMFVDEERKKLYKDVVNDGPMPEEHEVKISKDLWVSISFRSFMYELYGTVTSETTLKKAIHALTKKQFIATRYQPKSRYDAPEYQMNIDVIQGELDKLQHQGKREYQKLRVSKNEPLKILPSQEGQELIPSSSTSRTSRVSEIDTNRRSNSKKKLLEEDCAAIADAPTQTSSSSPEDEEEPKKKPRKRVPRNRKQEPIILEEEVRGRVDKFFSYVDTLGQQVTHDSEFHFAQDNAAIQAVVDILPLKPTESKIKQLFLSMWNAPRSQNGFLWQEHMDIPNICKEFKRKNIQLSAQSVSLATNGTGDPPAQEIHATSYALKYREKAAKYERKEAK